MRPYIVLDKRKCVLAPFAAYLTPILPNPDLEELSLQWAPGTGALRLPRLLNTSDTHPDTPQDGKFP